jgi:hypothetical protein
LLGIWEKRVLGVEGVVWIAAECRMDLYIYMYIASSRVWDLGVMFSASLGFCCTEHSESSCWCWIWVWHRNQKSAWILFNFVAVLSVLLGFTFGASIRNMHTRCDLGPKHVSISISEQCKLNPILVRHFDIITHAMSNALPCTRKNSFAKRKKERAPSRKIKGANSANA